ERNSRVRVNFLFPSCRRGISLNIVLDEGNTARLEEFTRFSAVTTPACGEHLNTGVGNNRRFFLRRNLLHRTFQRLELLLFDWSHLRVGVLSWRHWQRLDLIWCFSLLRWHITKMHDTIFINPFVDFPVRHSTNLNHKTQEDQEESQVSHNILSGISFLHRLP